MKPTEISVDKRDTKPSGLKSDFPALFKTLIHAVTSLFGAFVFVLRSGPRAFTGAARWSNVEDMTSGRSGGTASKWDSCADRQSPRRADVSGGPDQKILDEQTTETEVTNSDNKLYAELF